MSLTNFPDGVNVGSLEIDGTPVAAVDLSGVTASAAELNLNDGAVAGTAVASKTLALGASKDVDTLDITTLKLGGVAVTASAAEVNLLAGAGAAVASGTPVTHIADPSGAVTDQDDEARAAIALIIDALEAFGIDPGA